MNFLKNALLLCLLCTYDHTLCAQSPLPKNWFSLDQTADGYNGVSSEKVLESTLKSRQNKTVVVAILDSGVDFMHEDLKGNMWINKGEIPNNGKDDDNNGYIDDIHGWNFIGGKNGENVSVDNLEVTRVYAKLKYKFSTADPDKIPNHEKKDYALFLKTKNDVESRRQAAQEALDGINQSETLVRSAINAVVTALADKPLTMQNIELMDGGDSKSLTIGLNITKQVLAENQDILSTADLIKFIDNDFAEGKKHYENELNYSFNPDFDSRKIVGDNKNDIHEKKYGNNDVKGPDATHGTHVAGLIGAMRGNNIGMNGIATNVKIMSVRCVPDGDERDKDIANAIRYAVDNGATVINMSFGKGYSPDKALVDEAVKYAASKDVLLVHAAGNSAQDNDKDNNFPNKKYQKKKFLSKNKAPNWLEIGALSYKPDENMVASFSNYGKKSVDVFSPGVAIYSTTPENTYQNLQGTSMASPIAAGVATMLRSYFPTLTAKQVIKVIKKSTSRIDTKVVKPGSEDLVKFSELSSTGGVINLEKAVTIALKTKGKKNVKNWSSNHESNEPFVKP